MTTRYLVSLLAVLSGTAFAAPRSLQQAQAIALQTLSSYSNSTEVSLMPQAARSAQRPSADEASAELVPYYIFTDSQQQAFVIVSGSDLMPEVLGYGNSTLPENADQLPLSMRSWLCYVSEVQDYVEQHPESASMLQQAQASAQVVSPLLTTTWGQDNPYYNQCPKKNGEQTVTGCMATSISQVINYNEYPAQFEGSHSYKDNGVTRSLNFSEISIDYSLLRDSYRNSQGSTEEKAEVAKLMYAVGIALDMNYGTNDEGGSGATSTNAYRGLVENLGQKRATRIQRQQCSLDEWNEILQFELTNQRPVVMDGHSSEGGHSFVVDGVDSRGYYHINWGWDSAGDGYFDVSVLHPSVIGTGASEASDGFNQYQDIFVGIGNPANLNRWYSPLTMPGSTYISVDKSSVSLGQDLTLTASSVYNFSPSTFKGYVGVLLTKDGEVYLKQEGSSKITLASYYRTGSAVKRSITLPESMPEGEYRLYLYARSEEESEDMIDIIRQDQNRENFWTVTVSGQQASVSRTTEVVPIDAIAWSFENEELTTAPSTVGVTLENYGNNSMACIFYARFTRPDGTQLSNIEAEEIVTVTPGVPAEAKFNVKFDQAGQWKVRLQGKPVGLDNVNKQTLCNETFNVAIDPTRGAELELQSAPILVNDSVFNGELLTMELAILNNGLDYDGKASIRIFKNANSTASSNMAAEMVLESVQIAAGENTTLTFSEVLNIPNLNKNVKYYARGYYLYGDEMVEMEAKAGVTNKTAVPIRKARESGINEVTVDNDAEDLSNAAIYNLLGKRVSLPASGQLSPGIYIINGKKRVIKQTR